MEKKKFMAVEGGLTLFDIDRVDAIRRNDDGDTGNFIYLHGTDHPVAELTNEELQLFLEHIEIINPDAFDLENFMTAQNPDEPEGVILDEELLVE